MMKFKKSLFATATLALSFQSAFAFAPFIVDRIKVTGLSGLSSETVMHYLAVKPGQQVDDAKSSQIIHDLYQTGFFQTVNLSRDGNTLIVNVSELPVIASLKVVGNNSLPADKLKEVLHKLGIQQGQIFNRGVLQTVCYGLQQEYVNEGKFDAKVTSSVTNLGHNSVAVNINVNEGGNTTVRSIRITGNHVFSEHQLLKQLTLTTPGLFTFFTKNDQYTQEKFDKDLDALKSFYLDHGYVKYHLDAEHTTFSPDNKSVAIDIAISEGVQYKLTGFELEGNLPVAKTQLLKDSKLKIGDAFSRQVVIDTQKSIAHELANVGYAFAIVQIVPNVNDQTHTVSLVYRVSPGRLVYVRHINFEGNTKSEDFALRQAMLQMESGVVNMKNIDDSVRNLNNLGYVKNVSQTLTPVTDTNNQVDMLVHVDEMPSATLTGSVGYSTTEKFLVGATFAQPNFLGSGRAFNISFTNSAASRVYSVSFNDPYYTIDGVSRGFNVYMQHFNPSRIGITSGYAYNNYGGSVDYGIPITIYDRINFGFGLQKIRLLLGPTPATYIRNFVSSFGQRFNEFILSSSYVHNDWDRAVFPTKGFEQSIGGNLAVPLSSHSARYYKLNYHTQSYLPLTKDPDSFLLMFSGLASYGNGYGATPHLPFFANYFGGGIDSDIPLEGYEGNSVGPRDENGNPTGGNFGVGGKLGLILPQFYDSVRSMAFLGAARVSYSYNVQDQLITNDRRFHYATGVSMEWRSFLGTLVFSVATPLHKQVGDQGDVFQFTIGSNF